MPLIYVDAELTINGGTFPVSDITEEWETSESGAIHETVGVTPKGEFKITAYFVCAKTKVVPCR